MSSPLTSVAAEAGSQAGNQSPDPGVKRRVTFKEIMQPWLSEKPTSFTTQSSPSKRMAVAAVSSSAFPFGPVPLPLLPEVVARGGFELPEMKDPLAFMEWCPVRGLGASVAGGVMGFIFGAVFAGYGSLAPYDPALRDFQVAQARANAAQAAAAAGGATTAVAGTAATGTAGVASATAAAARPVVAEVLAPVYIPGVTPPPVAAAPVARPAGVATGAAAASSAVASLPASAAAGAAPATGPSALAMVQQAEAAAAAATAHPSFSPNMSMYEPPQVPLRQALREGLLSMKERSVSSAKNFAIMGGIYTTIECSLERIRGKKDINNAVASGFCTGAILAARAGPAAAMLGGAGFGAFSAVIEVLSPYLFDH